MKKKILSLLTTLLALGLSSCVLYNGQGKPGASKEKVTPSSSAAPASSTIEPSIPPAPHGGGEGGEVVPPETTVKVYLVFGETGLYDGQPVTGKDEALFLEHVKELTGTVGADLPGKDKVTSTVEGSTFVAWTAYNNDGKLTEYTKFPSVDNKILYASFTGGKGGSHSGGGSGGGDTPTPSEYPGSTKGDLPTTGRGLKFFDGSYMAGVETEPFEGFDQYVITKRSFKQGQTFALCNFDTSAAWTVPINEYSFGKNVSQYIVTEGGKYTVIKDFNAESIYLKFKYEADEIYFELA